MVTRGENLKPRGKLGKHLSRQLLDRDLNLLAQLLGTRILRLFLPYLDAETRSYSLYCFTGGWGLCAGDEPPPSANGGLPRGNTHGRGRGGALNAGEEAGISPE